MTDFHIFLSYARKDDRPASPGGEGWVSAFERRLREQHLVYAGKPLKVFFDRQEIADDADWERRIFQGLRTSRLFLAFLSPNYFASRICRREWEEYLRLEHTLARGDEGIKQIYFVDVPGLHDGDPGQFDESSARWIEDVRRRNLHHSFDLRPWFDHGVDLLREMDAAGRLEALRADPRSDGDRKIVSLADQLAAIDRAIARRLDQIALAELAPGNIDASYANFVGRSTELRKLHASLIADRIGVVGALHGLGGQGKTALAVQYAYAYAGHYAAGGRWIIPCEGRRHLSDALEALVPLLGLAIPEPEQGRSEEEGRAFTVKAIVSALKRRVDDGVSRLPAALAGQMQRHGAGGDAPEIAPHILLILDNVDQPDLLSSSEAALVAGAHWLQIIVTTRLDPARFGVADRSLSLIPVDDLPPEDALALLRRLRPFAGEEEEQAARRLVALLGGFTFAVELAGAFLQVKPEITYCAYVARLEAEGLTASDAPAADETVAARIRYEREKQVGRIVEDTLATLSPQAREILALAVLFPSDQIVLEWLRPLAAERFPELAEERVEPGYPDPFQGIMRDLAGRRLLPPSDIVNPYRDDLAMARMHRLIAAHLDTDSAPEEQNGRWGLMLGLLQFLGAFFEFQWDHNPAGVVWMVAPFTALAERVHAAVDHAESAGALSILSEPEARLGLLSRALDIEGRAFATRKRLHEASPDDAQAARGLSISFERLGDFFLRRGQSGDADRALQAFNESLSIDRRLHDASPDDAQAARDLFVSLDKLGNFFLRRGQSGDADRALQAFNESLSIDRRLHDASPDDAQAARDLSVSHSMLGQFFAQRGDEENAGAHLWTCFEILDGFHRVGRPMDPDMREIHQQLTSLFSASKAGRSKSIFGRSWAWLRRIFGR
jgi:tetratricopeptide (TPR) repeat protein